MLTSPQNDKIEKYLVELAEEYKTLLFNALLTRSKSLEDLSVSDLLRLDNEIKKPLLEDYKRQQKRRKLFLVIGLTYMLLGFFVFVLYKFVNSSFEYSPTEMIPLMSAVIGFIGLFFTVISFVFPSLRLTFKKHTNSEKQKSPALIEYEVITKWRDLEGVTSDINVDSDVKAPRSIIEYLLMNKLIDDNEYKLLKHFLKMRNDIVHSSSNKYTSEEIKDVMGNVDMVINRLKKIV